jgi:hypothetical protein
MGVMRVLREMLFPAKTRCEWCEGPLPDDPVDCLGLPCCSQACADNLNESLVW